MNQSDPERTGRAMTMREIREALGHDVSPRPPVHQAVWIDGDPLMEAIAHAVWEGCGTDECASVTVDDPRNIAAVVAAVVSPPTDRAAVLTEAERTMLTYALDQAQERIWVDDGFTHEDQAALDSLRRLAVEAHDTGTQQPEAPDDLATARATNQRLNYEKQRLESELAAYRRAVGQWEVSERGTYIPHSSLRVIGKACGVDILGTVRHLKHFERVEQAEAAIERVRQLHDRLAEETDLTSPDDSITRGAVAKRIAAALDGWNPSGAPQCDVEFEGGGRCAKPAGHRPPGSDDPHVPAPVVQQAAAAETDEERADREATERDHARGDHTYCGITCETEMPTEHLRNFVIAKGYPGTRGALDELLRRARTSAAEQQAAAADGEETSRCAHTDIIYGRCVLPIPHDGECVHERQPRCAMPSPDGQHSCVLPPNHEWLHADKHLAEVMPNGSRVVWETPTEAPPSA
ncbi:hypothetical protein ACFC8N_42615 [Streptomyces sp. NPDC055966]|uniref:hypothetical protein n=1 Tax=Streptomyces sp. NPDC055966 TaxID=3345669 RepID=UPI0035E1CA8A